MSSVPVPRVAPAPALRRLDALAALDGAGIGAVGAAMRQAVSFPARRDIAVEGKPAGEARMIVEGWAARVRIQADGRRQFLSFLLPGDLIGLCAQPDPVATSTVTALTTLKVCPAPAVDEAPVLATVYATTKALEEALDQIARLGRLNAQERVLHLLLELHERLALAGLTDGGSFDMPLTQEQVADALGLTSVHINRMIQQARREVGLIWAGKRVTIADVDRLGAYVGRMPVRVSGTAAPE